MSNWGEWSQCSNSCGRGRKHRKRAVTQEAAFGGKRCPTPTKSKKACYGDYGCLQQSVEYSREEIRGKSIIDRNFQQSPLERMKV